MKEDASPLPGKKRKRPQLRPGETSEEYEVRESSSLERQRLASAAFAIDMIGKEPVQNPHILIPSKAVQQCDGRDIIRKGALRKCKYLFAFPGSMKMSSNGELGQITQLNTPNPLIYFNFPEGRIKFFGSLVYTPQKYITFHCGSSKGVICEDIFEQLVIFSEFSWVGKAEENPSEKPLPLPENIFKKICTGVENMDSQPTNSQQLSNSSIPDTQDISDVEDSQLESIKSFSPRLLKTPDVLLAKSSPSNKETCRIRKESALGKRESPLRTIGEPIASQSPKTPVNAKKLAFQKNQNSTSNVTKPEDPDVVFASQISDQEFNIHSSRRKMGTRKAAVAVKKKINSYLKR
eukprot:Sdes_comp20504_c0_seq1m14985